MSEKNTGIAEEPEDSNPSHESTVEMEDAQLRQRLHDMTESWRNMRHQMNEEGLGEVFGLMFHGASVELVAAHYGIPIDEAYRRAQRIGELIALHEPPSL